jgi:hypothetical protein
MRLANSSVAACYGFVFILSALLFSGTARAADPNEALVGTWQGQLVINPSTRLTVQFIVRRNDQGKYSAVLNAPGETNLQNVAVTTFSFTGDKVLFAVDEVGGSYEGTLNDRKMTGKWKQSGSAFDLVLSPYVKPIIPAATVAHLEGPWNGVLSIPNTDRKLALVINFKADTKSGSGVIATIDSPDQGAFGIQVDEVTVQDGEVHVSVLRPKMGFSGTIAGNELVGRWMQGGTAPLTFTKGKYQAGGIDLQKRDRDRLAGNWYGQFTNGVGLAFRFKQDANGKLSAFLDSPYEGRNGLPINAISIDGDKISMRIDGVGGVYNGTLAKDEISGKFSAGGEARELILKRGEYVAETLQVAADVSNKLIGSWEGRAANTYIVLRFKLNERGDLLAVQDIPNRQMFGLPITDLSLKDDDLRLTVKGIAAEFKGKLAKNQLSGDWTMPTLQFPLTFNRTELSVK